MLYWADMGITENRMETTIKVFQKLNDRHSAGGLDLQNRMAGSSEEDHSIVGHIWGKLNFRRFKLLLGRPLGRISSDVILAGPKPPQTKPQSPWILGLNNFPNYCLRLYL